MISRLCLLLLSLFCLNLSRAIAEEPASESACELSASGITAAVQTLAMTDLSTPPADIEKALRYLTRIYTDADPRLLYRASGDVIPHIKFWGPLAPPELVRGLLRALMNFEFDFYRRHAYQNFFSKTAHIYLREYFSLRRLFAIDDPIFAELSPFIRHSRATLRLTPVLDQLPPSWIKEIRRYWLKDDPAQVPRIAGLRVATDIEAASLLWDCGHCTTMSSGHVEGIENIGGIANDVLAVSSLIYIGDQLVGALKDPFQGSPSMLALDSLADGRGNLILARGMVYRVASELVDRASEADWPREIHLKKNTDFPVRGLLSIDVEPSELLNGEDFFSFAQELRDHALSGGK